MAETTTIALTARGFLFDMDGTLVDSTSVVEQVWSEWAAVHDVDIVELAAIAHGRQAAWTVRHFCPDLSEDEHRASVAWLAREEERRLDGVVEVPGAAALLRQLADAGAPVALVTSAHRALADARMTAAGVPMPAVVITSDTISRSKPDPQGYRVGAASLGLTAPDCIGFEDAPAGIAAVLSAGAGLVTIGADAEAALVRLDDYLGASVEPVAGGWTIAVR